MPRGDRQKISTHTFPRSSMISGLNTFYERQFNKHKAISDWGIFRPASGSGGKDTSCDTKGRVHHHECTLNPCLRLIRRSSRLLPVSRG